MTPVEAWDNHQMARLALVVTLVGLLAGCGSSQYAGAESIIVRLESPLPVEEVDAVAGLGTPALEPRVAYFFVPNQEPRSVGQCGLENGARSCVDFLAEVFAEDGRTGADQLRVYGIAFAPAESGAGVDEATEIFVSLGHEVSACSIPVEEGGCSLYPPSE